MKERSDEELLDSLYGERADRPGDQGRSRRDAADDDDEDLDQLRRLRGVFAELKASQEEPPPAGMALLMAAARQAAEERKPKQEGLWAKLRAGWAAMVAHPAMAAATAAVVVIGASGYLMSRGVKTAESTYSGSEGAPAGRFEEKSLEQGGARSTSAAAAAAPSPNAEPAPDPAAIAAPEAPAAKLEMATGSATGTGAAASGEQAERDRRQVPAKKAKPMTAPREELGGLVEGGSSGAGGGDANNRLDDSYAKQNPGAISGSGSSSAGKAPRPSSSPPPPPPPPAQAAPEPSPESESAEESDSASASRDEAKKKSGVESITQQSERWYQLARDAAAKGDCNAVRLLAERVQSENPGFYEKRFKKDSTITKCL